MTDIFRYFGIFDGYFRQDEDDQEEEEEEQQRSTKNSKKKKRRAPEPKEAAAEEPSNASEVQSVSTEIGAVNVGSRLWIKWVDPSCPTAFGQWYGADVTGLTKREVAVQYPENAGWEAWDETLPVSDIIPSRVR